MRLSLVHGLAMPVAMAVAMAMLPCGCADDGAPPTVDAGGEATADPPSTPDVGVATSGPHAEDPHRDPADGLVRFIAMGDGGEGNDAQYAVADVVEQVCSERGCDFTIYLGDNFYEVGVESAMDQQFQDKFELPYADLGLPFYVALGNHDYGILGADWVRGQYQVEYTEFSDKWTLPSEFYTFDAQHVSFVALDTAQLFYRNQVEEQRAMLRARFAEPGPKYTVAFGHHPYRSNGRHGNAGHYEGASSSVFAGRSIETFFDEEVCGKVTVYFSGHDHNRQWHPFDPECATHFIVSGAASKTTDFADRDGNPEPLFAEDQTPGFAWVQIEGATMTVAFYDETGAKNFEHAIELTPYDPGA